MLQYPVGMLSFVLSLLSIELKYKKYLKLAGFLLVFGYISLLAFVFVAFNKYDTTQSTNASTHRERMPGMT
ncbi:hypothetical protein Q8A64_18440 [Oxalobacteraceae bacterium R-40]|uniref:Uncharacterized protein n=1 Tax=Keguizhuia sedimenti TaxID=3064264 RepID=A0ABU1BTQ8_9BURK|nr:hypothetical protein [Oxalobacteraceae bacterium R-40]